MNFSKDITKSPPFRIGVSVFLAIGALGLFWMSRNNVSLTGSLEPPELTQVLASDIDRSVDSILTKFRIEKAWIKKSTVPMPNSPLFRFERNIVIPRDVLPVQVNVAMNTMARRYHGKAIAYENVKENSVIIHIEIQGNIVQKILLKTNDKLHRQERKIDSPKT